MFPECEIDITRPEDEEMTDQEYTRPLPFDVAMDAAENPDPPDHEDDDSAPGLDPVVIIALREARNLLEGPSSFMSVPTAPKVQELIALATFIMDPMTGYRFMPDAPETITHITGWHSIGVTTDEDSLPEEDLSDDDADPADVHPEIPQ